MSVLFRFGETNDICRVWDANKNGKAGFQRNTPNSLTVQTKQQVIAHDYNYRKFGCWRSDLPRIFPSLAQSLG
ncbi:Ceruloplasmin [Manis pentadactyla]|nr:Ceruloplasmin [Manis pentadactyla]